MKRRYEGMFKSIRSLFDAVRAYIYMCTLWDSCMELLCGCCKRFDKTNVPSILGGEYKKLTPFIHYIVVCMQISMNSHKVLLKCQLCAVIIC